VNNRAKFNKRKERVRSQIKVKSSYPRLSVHISNKNIYACVIDDANSNTLCSSSTKVLKISGANITNAVIVGEKIAEQAKKSKVTNVVFDRGGYLYHGKVKALSEAARNKGLIF
jgi:large subunit ribosomal protein L18